MTIFLLLFALAILFVVGSAGAMRYFDKRTPPKKKDDNNQP